MLTNLYKEHADWHGSEAAYRRDKLLLLELPGVKACVAPAGLALGSCAHFGDLGLDQDPLLEVEGA